MLDKLPGAEGVGIVRYPYNTRFRMSIYSHVSGVVYVTDKAGYARVSSEITDRYTGLQDITVVSYTRTDSRGYRYTAEASVLLIYTVVGF